MRISAELEQALAAKYEALLPHLNERQRRLAAGADARMLGHGGIRVVARAAGMREGRVSPGAAELESGEPPLGRARREGGGRKRSAELDPGLVPALLALVEPDMRGDPESPLRWTARSTASLAGALTAQGHRVSASTVADLLREQGFSLQANARTLEGRAQHPDRDAQFRYINEQARAHRDAGEPVVSVDTKKKELAGEYKNSGREWRPAGEPARVRDHDFPDAELGKAIPYGIYDIAANAGWVNVGTDHDTAAFAVESIRRWWQAAGQAACPAARRLLVTADAGGSNGYRTRAWKAELAALALETGLEITVCHFPPGTSKWNAIEHRLFSCISMNWRGRPLTSHQVIVNTIAATTTRGGLRVRAELDTGACPAGQAVSDAQLAALPITRHHWHGQWNYALHPRHPSPAPAARAARSRDLSRLCHPAITGMPASEWDDLLTRLTVPRQAQREAFLHNQRGHPRKRPPGTGAPPRLTLPGRLLATILDQRHALPRPAIAALLGVQPPTIRAAIRDTRQLLDQIRHPIRPAVRLHSLDDLASHAATAGLDLTQEIKAAC
jgi:hypothetical protein